jgi:L,D-transpeptidase YcbB
MRKPAQSPEFQGPILIDAPFINSNKLQCTASVQYFYDQNKNELVWTDSSGLTDQAEQLVSFINGATGKGLDPAEYHLNEFPQSDSLEKNERKRIDVLLTDSYLNLFRHLSQGRLDSARAARLNLSGNTDSAAVASLTQALGAGTVRQQLEQREPVVLQYRSMRDTLTFLTGFAADDSATLAKKRMLALNIERLKRYPERPSRYVYVNIPSFMMYVIENDSIVFESKVIVGKQTSQTPEIHSIIRSFIIYPYWHVPRGIATKEILPLVQKDSTYLLSHNFEVLDRSNEVLPPGTIDWASLSVDYFPYTLRQREGSENSLGIFKFVFNSPYDIYLHDTNGRRSFKKEKRALSHGCVRVHRATDFAKYLVKDDSIYTTMDDLEQYLSLKERVQIRVMKPLPVYIEYATCEFRNGRINYYADIYDRDLQLENALYPQESVPNL